ncbi:hypothetical protein K450DRAFT_258207 [Umbelopsis ramanniana AG]|uniref:Uncharacterized protein n=1 Tax=Umbelopsis ramanniana AG TaxID=1314678 RepID=A0AAD5E2B6_UMBRA|nr:uncharacterized protein K450DRAFT_258207 [Umbelopsis ramanniana AG]KAI8576141.1 hypothetical protein K450DRAFT_258207 [Umbelopsis ramanniana AG]
MQVMSQPVLIVTGASRGIGKAVALSAIKSLNANVLAVARSKDLLEVLKQDVDKCGKGHCLEIVVGDLTDERVVTRAIDRAIDRWGRIDGVVANAGVLEPMALVEDAPVQGWKKLFDINLFSIITLVQEALSHLKKTNGRIINVSSGAATKAYRGWGAYGASKAALNHLTETLAVEEPNITTIAIRPGVVDTDMQGLIRQEGKASMGDFHSKFVDLHEQGKLVDPQDCGHVIASLSISGSKDLSGKFLSWDDDSLIEHRRKN